MTPGVFFNRQWWWTTLLVLAALGVMIRLALWQFERHTERQARNLRVSAQLAQPALNLNAALPADLGEMEYRAAVVTGEYDHAHQVALRNQVWGDRPGVHLLTPLRIEGSEASVLVDRGWIPLAESTAEHWPRFAEPGRLEVRGVIRRSHSRPDFGGVPDAAGPLQFWNLANVARIAEQIPYSLLPVYVQQAPDPARTALPHRSQPELDLSDGSHLGYALQWLAFAVVLALGYPAYVARAGGATAKRESPVRAARL